MKVSIEFKIGLMVLLAIVILFTGINYLKGDSLFGTSRSFYVVYEKVNGLEASAPVKINGMQVGRVKKVDFDYSNPKSKMVVEFSLTNDQINLPKNSFSTLKSDLLGTTSLEITLGDMIGDNPIAESGDTIQGRIDPSLLESIDDQFSPLKRKTEELLTSVESIIVSIHQFWDTSGVKKIEKSLDDVNKHINQFGLLAYNLNHMVETLDPKLNSTIDNIKNITQNIDEEKEHIKGIIANVNGLTDSLSQLEIKRTFNRLDSTIANLNYTITKVNSGEGTLGALLHDDSLYNGLLNTNAQLESLISDLENNPERYIHFSVFGRKDKSGKNTGSNNQNNGGNPSN